MTKTPLALLPLSLLLVLAACEPAAPTLQEGTWTGGLTPMNHPDMVTPLTYDVRAEDGAYAIALVGPGGGAVPMRSVRLEGDTLRYVFNEPEEGVALRCALGRQGDGSYAGRCTDPDGKWARFTMTPPAD